jgi:Zn-dependent protease
LFLSFKSIGPPAGIMIAMFSTVSLLEIAIIFICILLSMSFHEAMHAFVGHSLGDTTARDEGRLTLNPLKHIDIITTVLLPLVLLLLGMRPFFAAKPVPFNPERVKYDEFGAAMIAVSGPLSNLLLAVVGANIVRLMDLDPGSLVRTVLLLFVQVNIGFFVFNMIPFPPLDGSRALYAVAPEPLQAFMRQIEAYGFSGILVFMFLLYPFLSPLVGSVTGSIYNLLI